MKVRRLAHAGISKTIEFDESVVCSMVVENQDFFRQIINDLHCQSCGEAGVFVLSEDFSPIDISKNMEMITQFVPFEVNRKNIISKICAAVEKNATDEAHFEKTQTLLADIERYMDELLFDYPYSFEYDKLNLSGLVKFVGLTISNSYENELEKILDYLQLVRDFDKERIFVFVNMRSYFNDRDMELFARDIVMRKFNILLIDSVEYPRLSCEKRLVIDADLCEIY